MPNVYNRAVEYLYQQNEIYYQSIEYFYTLPNASGLVKSTWDAIDTQARVDYINAEYTWQDGNQKVFGLNIEYIYAPANLEGVVNSIYDTSLERGISNISSIFDGFYYSSSGVVNSIYDAQGGSTGNFIKVSYLPFSGRRRVPFIFRSCQDNLPYPTGTAQC